MTRARWLAVLVVVVANVAIFYRLEWWRPASLDPGTSSPSKNNVLVGLTDQRLPVKLAVAEDGKTLSVDVSWIARCTWHPVGRRPAAVERTVRARVTRIADGRFSWGSAFVEPAYDGDEERRRLRLQGRRARDGTLIGTWRAEQHFYNGQLRAVERRCSTGDVQFRAQIGGRTSPPAPRTDASGRRVIALEGVAESVAVGTGSTWVFDVASVGRGGAQVLTVRELDPQTGRVGARSVISPWNVSYGDASFAAGAGAAWIAIQRRVSARGAVAAGMLRRIDARTHDVSRGPPHPRLEGLIRSVAVGAGAVWMLVNVEASAVTGRSWRGVLRADPRTGRVVRTIALPADPRIRATSRCGAGNDVAELMAVGAGAVWVASTSTYGCRTPNTRRDGHGRSTTLRRIDSRSNRVTRTIGLRQGYSRLAPTATGLWAATCSSAVVSLACDRPTRPALHRISLRDGRPTTVVRLPSGEITGLAANRNAVWVSQSRETGTGGALRRLDRATNQLATVRLQGAATNVSLGEGGVWVIDTFARTLIRVPL